MTARAARLSLLDMMTTAKNPTKTPTSISPSTSKAALSVMPDAAARDGEPAILVRGLRCSYGPNEAVKGIDLEIATGEIFALLGPNGAGKTTTIEILEGFRKRTGGQALVLGVDPADGGSQWRARIGVVLQESRPEPELTVRECVALYAGYYEQSRDIDETIALVGLGELAARRCEQLSGGEQRRLDVALALIGDPELVFLDEPTTGFDPAARRAAWELVADLRALGKTIILTTHYMEEAERLADRIAVLSHGEIVATGTPQTLGARELMDAQISFTLPEGVGFEELPASLEAPAPSGDRRVRVRAADPVSSLFVLSRWAVEHDLQLPDLEVRRPSLEDVYLQLTDTPLESQR
jgi:ABC-2 type transport system ATP-binding protein